MNKLKTLSLRASAAAAVMSATVINAFATDTTKLGESAPDVSSVAQPVVTLINSLIGPAFAIVGALGTLFCIILGVKYAKAEEPQDREKAKSHLKNAVIGFILIFVLILALKLMLPALGKWADVETTIATKK